MVTDKIIKFLKMFVEYIALFIIIGIGIYYFLSQPSDELLYQSKVEFLKNVSHKDIKRIIVYIDDEFGNGYKIEIVDNDIINKILKSSKIYYIEAEHRGGFKQHYLIRLDINGVFYNFGYSKMDKYDYNYCSRSGTNKYNDCGRIHLLKDIHSKKELHPLAYKEVIDLINIDLIPILKDYIDKKKDENPEQFRFTFKDE